MAEWTKGLGFLVHNEVWFAGGWVRSPPTWPSGLRAWDAFFTMKSGVWEVVGSIPASMAEWTKGLGRLVQDEVWCVGGCWFDPRLHGREE